MLKSQLIQMLRLWTKVIYVCCICYSLPPDCLGEQFSAGFRLHLKMVEGALLKLLMNSARVAVQLWRLVSLCNSFLIDLATVRT